MNFPTVFFNNYENPSKNYKKISDNIYGIQCFDNKITFFFLS
jgi:subtilase family serine protease